MADYTELVKALRHCAKQGLCNGCPRCGKRIKNCSAELKREAADAIEELSKPRWISVEERLPESDQRVIYHTTEGAVEFGKHKPEFSVFTQGEIFAWIRRDAVTHWMPLPEPPKEETE